MKKLISRLIQGAALLVVVSMLAFLLAELAPGDFLSETRLDPRMSEELAQSLRNRFGLDQPLHVRYWQWVKSVARGEGGFSLAHRRPVVELLAPRMLNTLTLTFISTVLAWGLALFLGIAGAYRAGGRVDRGTLLAVAGLLAVPELLLTLFGVWVALNTGLPLGGSASLDYDAYSLWGRILDRLRHLVIPVSVLVLTCLPPLIRHVRAAVLEALAQPFVHAARGHGIGGFRLLWGYVMPAAANPLITLLGISIGGLLSGSLVVEVGLGWPGIGPLVLEALMNRDLHVLLGGILSACAFLVVGNLMADVLLWVVDPKSRGAA